jgi:hypothetical protein
MIRITNKSDASRKVNYNGNVLIFSALQYRLFSNITTTPYEDDKLKIENVVSPKEGELVEEV